MAKKKQTEGDNILPMNLEPDAAPKWQWPDNREKRLLEIVLNKDERITIAEANAKLGEEKDQLEANKKASASRYKAQIEDVDARIRLNNTYVSTGRQDRQVECYWLYEVAGFDTDGSPIENADRKTLVRADTGGVVEIVGITENERQAALPLGDDPLDEDGDAQPVEVGDDE